RAGRRAKTLQTWWGPSCVLTSRRSERGNARSVPAGFPRDDANRVGPVELCDIRAPAVRGVPSGSRLVLAGTCDTARDLVLNDVGLLGNGAGERAETVAGLVELVDERENDGQARVLKPHAVVE